MTSYREMGKPMLLQEIQIIDTRRRIEMPKKKQLQGEDTCTLDHFYDFVFPSNEKNSKQSNVGEKILQYFLQKIE